MSEIDEKLARFRKNKPLPDENSTKLSLTATIKSLFSNTSPSQPIIPPHQNSVNTVKNKLNDNEDSFQRENQEIYEPEIEEPFRLRLIKIALKFFLWATLFALFIKLEFGIVYFVVSLLVLVYLNTGRRAPGTKSAYSVFNPNVERIQGQLTAEQLEKNLMRPF